MSLPVRRALFGWVVLASLWLLFSPGLTVPSGPPYSDKVVHLLLFAALALTGLRAGTGPAAMLLGLAVYAGSSELLQAVLPIHRHGDLGDVVVDLVGVLVGALAWRRLR